MLQRNTQFPIALKCSRHELTK